MKNVLLITSDFPPSNQVGAIRPDKFAKYLPEFGWQPIILTINHNQPVLNVDDQVPIPVYTASAPTLKSLYTLGRNLFPGQAIKPAETTDPVGKTKSYTGRAEIIESWLFVPDKAVTWFPFAVRKGVQIAKSYSIQAILSTSPDQTSHLVAKSLSKALKRPWVADFRDPWVQHTFYYYPTQLHRKLTVILERNVIKNADYVTTVSEAWRDDFVDYYRNQSPKKFGVVSNGYDKEDFKGISAVITDNDNTIDIVHNGKLFYSGKDPFPFLKAIQLLDMQNNPKINVKFVGVSPTKLTPTLLEMRLSKIVEAIDYMPHLESLRYILGADILLLFSGSGPGVLTAKVFEYLFTGKPIFALTPRDGSLAHLLHQANVGTVVDSESPQEIADALLNLVKKVQANCLPKPNWEFIKRFEYKALTGQLAQILNEITS